LEKKRVESEKISTEKIKAAKASLSSDSQKETPPMAPQLVAENSFLTLESLKPPPHPQKLQ